MGGATVLGVGAASATGGIAGFAAASAPNVPQGSSAVGVTSETFTLANQWTSGQTITFTVFPNGATKNCASATTDFVDFAAVPSLATPTGGVDTAPTFSTPVLSEASGDTTCSGTVDDTVTLTLTNSSTGSTGDAAWNLTLQGIEYNVGSTTTTGTVALGDSTTVTGGTSSATAAPNATVVTKANAGATGNSPQTNVTVGATAAVSNIVITEAAAGQVSDTICITPITSGETSFSFAGTPSTATTGNGTSITSTALSGSDILVTVAGTPSSAATTFTVSSIQVTDGAKSGLASAEVTTGGASCAADTTVIQSSVPVFNSAPALQTAIAGINTDATAIDELETAYPVSGGAGCVTSHSVILATDQNFPDALAASYLAGYLHTGILLTPTAALSSETQSALQVEGITNVYVVGGPLAVSQNTINEVEATPAYSCGGPGVGTATGSNIKVTGPIAGQTQYDTAEDIAATPPVGNVGSIDLAGAYGGQYNDTTGNTSSAPEAAGVLNTAIVASGANFPDASAASVMAYHNQFPLLLTNPTSLSSQASAGLSALGIKQVIVLGGPLAVSNADVTSIEGMGISVIRIAGQDATDTAQELASFELNQQGTAFTGLGWGATGTWHNTILVARGDFYSDALAGSVLAALNAEPLVLTENPSTVGQYLTAFLNAGGSASGIDALNAVSGSSGNIEAIQPLGGPLALNATTLTTMVADVADG
jgi:putative cell wall-binding protein